MFKKINKYTIMLLGTISLCQAINNAAGISIYDRTWWVILFILYLDVFVSREDAKYEDVMEKCLLEETEIPMPPLIVRFGPLLILVCCIFAFAMVDKIISPAWITTMFALPVISFLSKAEYRAQNQTDAPVVTEENPQTPEEQILLNVKKEFGEEVADYAEKFLYSNRIQTKSARKTAYPMLYKTLPKHNASILYFPDFENCVLVTIATNVRDIREDAGFALRFVIENTKERLGQLPFASELDGVEVLDGEEIMLVKPEPKDKEEICE